MDRLESIETFLAVAADGGFSAASRRLGVPVATVSRRVAQLEETLGALLLHRSTRHVALTEPGQRYFETCTRLVDGLKEADAEVAGEAGRIRGELTVTAPIGFGRMHLQPVLHEFLGAWPEIRVDLLLADQVMSLVEERVDCALRIGVLRESTLVARRLGSIGSVVCAAPAYLRRRGTPRRLEDLSSHDCISWTTPGAFKSWEFGAAGAAGAAGPNRTVAIGARICTTTAESAVDAAAAGLGLVQATTYQVAQRVEAGTLVPVLRKFERPRSPVHLLYATRRLVPTRLRAFIDFAAPRLEKRLHEIAAIL
jgi:DNA-binding transcriptional LysR family regulator